MSPAERLASEAFGASGLGLAPQVNTTFAKPGLDQLTVNALEGGDILIGRLGQDNLNGGPGNIHLIQ